MGAVGTAMATSKITSIGDGSADAAPYEVPPLADHNLGSKRALHHALVRVAPAPAERSQILTGMAEEDSNSIYKILR